MTAYTFHLPETLLRQLERRAAADRQPLDEWIRRVLAGQLTPLIAPEDDLPPHLHAELQAMAALSDAALWQLAQSALSEAELSEWDALIALAAERPLSDDEAARRAALHTAYDETVLRRAHAAMLLKSRGRALPAPAVSG